ncbi:MAG: sodium:solute symporter, partial [bacterium]|nr:sodium:solute symporter [bacterium]
AALAMMSVKSALDAWWQLAGIFSGGMLGLFLLGMISRRARNPAAVTGVSVGVLVIVWMTFSPHWTGRLEPLGCPFHSFMTIVVGTLSILLVGLLASRTPSRGDQAA